MSANLEAKKQVVEEIKTKIQNSKSVIFVDYKGLTVAEVSQLRNKFREAGVEYKVYKNTLVRKAMNDLGVTAFDNDLNGPTATAFSPDETAAAKIFAEAVKAMPEKIIPKSAYVDGAYVDANGIKISREYAFQRRTHRKDARLHAGADRQLRGRSFGYAPRRRDRPQRDRREKGRISLPVCAALAAAGPPRRKTGRKKLK